MKEMMRTVLDKDTKYLKSITLKEWIFRAVSSIILGCLWLVMTELITKKIAEKTEAAEKTSNEIEEDLEDLDILTSDEE